jgi:Na+/proline symporter
MSLPGLAVAILLIASLLLVHFSVRARPMPADRPLNVDTGLPLPEAGQASTVFSLTALFGAYFGIFIVLGLPAISGITVGTVISLFAIRKWIINSNSTTFEGFLEQVFCIGGNSGSFFATFISLIQCAYAASELLILKEISRVLLGLQHYQATQVAVAVGLIGYFYVLFGGWMAVFRTDVLQFVFVAAMALAFGVYALYEGVSDILVKLAPRSGYWELFFLPPSVEWITYVYQFLVGFCMGFSFLAAAPDAWKRVFVLTKLRTTSIYQFIVFIIVGSLPFILLVPVVFTIPPIPNGQIDTSAIYLKVPINEPLFIIAALGLTCSFLSSFNSAIISSTHVGIILKRTGSRVVNEWNRYYWAVVASLLASFFIFEAFSSLGNPYLLANLLLAPYTIAAAIQAGTIARPGGLPGNTALWIIVVSISIWVIYFGAAEGIPRVANTYQFNTVPIGVAFFPVIFVFCAVVRHGRRTT